MNCDDIQTLSPAWHSRELEEPQREAFVSHLRTCAQCAAIIEDQALLDARLRLLDASPDISPDIVLLKLKLTRQIRTRRQSQWILYAALAASLLAALFVGYGYRTPRILADAARDHRLEVIGHQPRRWKSETAEIDTIATQFGLTAARARAISPVGYQLLHARICGLGKRPALHLVFTNGAREISFYVRQSTAAQNVRTATIGNERVTALQNAGYTTVTVTGIDQPCEQLARQISNRI